MESKTQNMARMLQSMDKTQKSLAALILPKVAMNRVTDQDRSGSVSEVQLLPNVHKGPMGDQQERDRGKQIDKTGETGKYQEGNNWRQIRKFKIPILCGGNSRQVVNILQESVVRG